MMASVFNASATGYGLQASKSRYRPEIDGLRAFAVVAVIINHFNKDLLPSGYLGVDIFFVISGYVITSSLAGRQSRNLLDFLTGFYARRIKRLMPALVVFVLITSALIRLFNPDPGVALDLGWRSLFGISNINLYQTSTDYFAQSTALNPFTHTWSLGVEEQFYLLFPFLIWFSGFGQQTATGARNLFFWVAALTAISLISFIYLYQINQPAAYFLMPPRFWEMAAGCLIFIGFQKRAEIEQILEQVPPLLIVAAMAGVMFLPSAAAVPATIGIVALSAILIACLKKGTAAYHLFTLDMVVFIGLISYSLYLWHWGVLCISRWTIGIHLRSAPFQIAIMLVISAASYAAIEKSTRRVTIKINPGLFVIAGIASTSFAALLQQKLSDRIPFIGNSSISDLEVCNQNPSASYWIVGDSHAGEMQKAIWLASRGNCSTISILSLKSSEWLKMSGWHNVYQKTMVGRLPSLGSSELINMARKYRPKFIIFNIYWQGYFTDTQLPSYDGVWREFRVINENNTNAQEILSQSQALEYFVKSLSVFSKRVGDDTIILIIMPEAEFNWINMGGIGDRSKVSSICQGSWFSLYKPIQYYQKMCNDYKTGSTIPIATLHKRSKNITRTLNSVFEIIKSDTNSPLLIDTVRILCNSEFCSTHSLDGKLMYRDDDHINSNAAEVLAPTFRNIFTRHYSLKID